MRRIPWRDRWLAWRMRRLARRRGVTLSREGSLRRLAMLRLRISMAALGCPADRLSDDDLRDRVEAVGKMVSSFGVTVRDAYQGVLHVRAALLKLDPHLGITEDAGGENWKGHKQVPKTKTPWEACKDAIDSDRATAWPLCSICRVQLTTGDDKVQNPVHSRGTLDYIELAHRACRPDWARHDAHKWPDAP